MLVIVYDQEEIEVSKRSDVVFRENGYRVPDDEGKCHQNDISGLINLPINFINDFALDPMHLVYLGVTRRILYFLKGSLRKISSGKLSAAFLSAISKQLDDLKFPDEFSRQPRGLSELDRKLLNLNPFYFTLVLLCCVLTFHLLHGSTS